MANLGELSAPATNRSFLERVFAGSEDSIWLAAFVQDPSQAPPGVWGGAPFRLGEQLYDEIGAKWLVWNHNTYFCVSTFKETGGKASRKLDSFAANYAVVLDDVGTKVPLADAVLKPTWALETSPGNYQLGYQWNEPITDVGLASRITSALSQQGLSDPSGHSVTRYVRLPQGANTKAKHGRPFRHILRMFSPSLRYAVEDFVSAFKLDLERTSARNKDCSALAAHGAQEGCRNQSLAQLAGHLFSSYFGPPAVAYELLMKWAQCCDPPMSPQEADATIRSIWRKERQRRERDS